MIAEAERQGYRVEVDKTGRQYAFTIRDMQHELNPVIETDRRGAEAFLLGGIDDYLYYCEMAGIEPF